MMDGLIWLCTASGLLAMSGTRKVVNIHTSSFVIVVATPENPCESSLTSRSPKGFSLLFTPAQRCSQSDKPFPAHHHTRRRRTQHRNALVLHLAFGIAHAPPLTVEIRFALPPSPSQLKHLLN
jgi:hypothetical protein